MWGLEGPTWKAEMDLRNVLAGTKRSPETGTGARAGLGVVICLASNGNRVPQLAKCLSREGWIITGDCGTPKARERQGQTFWRRGS